MVVVRISWRMSLIDRRDAADPDRGALLAMGNFKPLTGGAHPRIRLQSPQVADESIKLPVIAPEGLAFDAFVGQPAGDYEVRSPISFGGGASAPRQQHRHQTVLDRSARDARAIVGFHATPALSPNWPCLSDHYSLP